MALRMTCLAGLLMFSHVQAGDIADGSTKFMAHRLNRMEYGGRPEAFKSQKIADNQEDTDVQKLFSNESNKPIGFSAIAVAVALLSVAAMVGVRVRRRMQPALACSSGHGVDMSLPLATFSAVNTLGLKSNSSFLHWDPLGLGESALKAHVKNFRESELQHGQAATTAVFFVSAPALRTRSLEVTMSSEASAGAKMQGTVKWFNTVKGFGFITPEGGGSDVFVHQTQIYARGFRSLAEGEPVEYEVEVDDSGRQQAMSVTGPGGDYVQGEPRPPRRDDDYNAGYDEGY